MLWRIPSRKVEVSNLPLLGGGAGMSGRLAKEGKGLAFTTGWCVGSAVRAARGILPGAGSRSSALDRLREGMFRALLKLYVGSIESEPEMGSTEDVDGALEKAKEIGQIVLDSGSRGTHARIHVSDITEIDGLDGSKISERAIRKNQCSIARFGLLNPLVVRQVDDRFQLLHGHARYEGCKRLGLREVPVLVKEVEEVEAVELALLDILLGNGASHVEPDCLRAVLKFYTGLWRGATSRGCTRA
jgi:hypothetical protein